MYRAVFNIFFNFFLVILPFSVFFYSLSELAYNKRIIFFSSLFCGGIFTFFTFKYLLFKRGTKFYIQITKTIANTLEMVEKNTQNLLSQAIYILEEKLLNNNIKNEKDLLKLRDKLNVSHLDILESDGGVFLNTKQYTKKEKDSYYNDFKLFSHFPNYLKIKKSDDVLSIPYSWNKTRGLATKNSIKWSKELKKVIGASDYSITDEVKDLFNFYSNTIQSGIKNITIFTPSGKVLAEVKKSKNIISVNEYIKVAQVYKNKNLTNIELSFGGLKTELDEVEQKELTTKNGEYFYNLNVEFENNAKKFSLSSFELFLFTISTCFFISGFYFVFLTIYHFFIYQG